MFDYLVMGGDPVACVLAARLSDNPALDVALLEPAPPPRCTSVPQPGLNGRCVALAPVPPGPAAPVRPNLQVFAGVQATRILHQGRRAVGLEFWQGGQLKQLRTAGEVLLCAGAVQSPQLLLLSGMGDHPQLLANGIATVHHLPGVGLGLQDGVELLLPATPAWWPWARAQPMPPGAPPPGLQWRHRPYRRGTALHIRLLQPVSRGSVCLHGKDPLQPPRIHPNLLGDRDDLERLQHGLQQAQPSPRRLRSAVELEFHLRETALAAGDLVGSCRQGPGAMDVVDARLRVHGMAGLRVVDASVLLHRPDRTRLAEIAAQMLREDAAQG